MKYSDLCNFKTNYKTNKKEKHNVIIVTLFRLKHLYKNFSEYLNGLIGFDEYLSLYDDMPNNIKLRVYWNKTIYETNDKVELKLIKDTMKKIGKNKHIQLVEYLCPMYKLDNIYDRGVFPFFIRYFPLFDFEDNDTNFIFANDIDITEYKKAHNAYQFTIDTFNNMIKKKMDFYCLTSKCYIPFWKKNLGNDSLSLLGGLIGGKYKFDHNILIDFLKDCEPGVKSSDKLLSQFYKNYVDYIHNPRIPEEFKKKKMRTYEIDKIFVYGLDEFFITYYLFKKLLADKKVKNIYEHTRNTAQGGLYKILNNVFHNVLNNINNSEETIELYKNILYKLDGKEYKNNDVIPKFREFIEKLKKHDYNNATNNPVLYNAFYGEITKIMKTKDSKYLNLVKSNDLKCFIQNDKYYTDKNNLIKLDNVRRKLYYTYLTV
jgi:hypothetical protein